MCHMQVAASTCPGVSAETPGFCRPGKLRDYASIFPLIDVDGRDDQLLEKAGPNLVSCGPIFGTVGIAERSALGDHTFSKGPHSGRDRFTGLQETSHDG